MECADGACAILERVSIYAKEKEAQAVKNGQHMTLICRLTRAPQQLQLARTYGSLRVKTQHNQNAEPILVFCVPDGLEQQHGDQGQLLLKHPSESPLDDPHGTPGRLKRAAPGVMVGGGMERAMEDPRGSGSSKMLRMSARAQQHSSPTTRLIPNMEAPQMQAMAPRGMYTGFTDAARQMHLDRAVASGELAASKVGAGMLSAPSGSHAAEAAGGWPQGFLDTGKQLQLERVAAASEMGAGKPVPGMHLLDSSCVQRGNGAEGLVVGGGGEGGGADMQGQQLQAPFDLMELLVLYQQHGLPPDKQEEYMRRLGNARCSSGPSNRALQAELGALQLLMEVGLQPHQALLEAHLQRMERDPNLLSDCHIALLDTILSLRGRGMFDQVAAANMATYVLSDAATADRMEDLWRRVQACGEDVAMMACLASAYPSLQG